MRLGEKEHAELLKRFFSSLFDPEGDVYIFPSLSDEKREYYQANLDELPSELHGKELRKLFDPFKVLDPFKRKAASTDIRLIGKLNDFVSLGYDIFFAANPLTCSKRCQKTVFEARHIVLEADSGDIEEQKRILQQHQHYFSAMLFSGNRSIHAYAKIAPAIPNYSRVFRNEAFYLKKGNTSCSLPEYKELANLWIDELRQDGLQVDTNVALDFSRLSRVPGFKHSKSGKEAEVIFLNPAPLSTQSLHRDRIWQTEIAPLVWEDDVAISIDSTDTASITQSEIIMGSDIFIGISNTVSSSNNGPIDSNNPSPILDSSTDTPFIPKKYLGGEKGRGGTAKTSVIHRDTFLTHLSQYATLKTEGIPSRGMRRKLHVSMFVTARILGWGKGRLEKEWLSITSMKPENIGMSPEDAVIDLIRHYEKGQTITDKITLPNTLSLPEDPFLKRDCLLAALKAWGCRKEDRPNDVASIILRVLWKAIRTLPVQCMQGKTGIRALEVQHVCARKVYRPAMNWLEEANILKVTDADYKIGRKTRRYFVNSPLILYLMGFKEAELDWSAGRSNTALTCSDALSETQFIIPMSGREVERVALAV